MRTAAGSGSVDVESLRTYVRAVPDFPRPGVMFRDICPLLRSADALATAADLLAAPFLDRGVDVVVGIESRGFIFGPLVARRLGAGFVPVRKKGKLPHDVLRESYDLEYGTDHVEMHVDAVRRGEAALIVDDVIATGGTARAACQLVERAGGEVSGLSFLIELQELCGRNRLPDRIVHAVMRF
jgi:adenine phosphoribosyltransferase